MRSRPGQWQVEVKQPYAAIPIKQDETAVRNRRILKIFWWTLPLVVVFILVGSALVGLYFWSSNSLRYTETSDWQGAESSYTRQAAATKHFPMPWVADYNLGTVLTHQGNLELGMSHLQRAYDGVPKAILKDDGQLEPFSYECQVRINISANLEAEGDRVAESIPEKAVDLYEDALDWVYACQVASPPQDQDEDSEDDSGGQGDGEEGEEGDEGASQQLEDMGNPGGEASDRLQDKIDALEGTDDDGDDGDDGDSGTSDGQSDGEDQDEDEDDGERDPFEGESSEDRDRREELQDKNREQAERERERAEQSERRPGTGGW